MTFATQPQGIVGAPQTVSIVNRGAAPLRIRGFAFSGTNPADFFVGADVCHTTIDPGASCTLQVRFAPQGQGARSAVLTVFSNAPTSPTVALSGTGGALPQGPPGPRGPRGPAGRDAKVTCTVKKKPGTRKLKVTCKVRLVRTTRATLHWRLVRKHRTYAHGVAFARKHHATIKLPDLKHLRSGRYVLRIAGGRHGTAIVIKQRR